MMLLLLLFVQLAQAQEPWWTSWDEPELSALIEEGLQANPDLGALDALARQQQALAAQGMADFLPSLSFDVQGQLAPYDSLGFGFGLPGGTTGPDTYGTGSAKLNAGLMVDLWGRNVTGWQAGRLDAAAAAGDHEARAVLMASSIAGAWLDTAAAARQVALVEEQERVASELLEIVQLRYEGGSASALDLLQQRQQQASVRAQLPLARASLRTAQLRLAVLLARDPQGELPSPPPDLPTLPAAPDLGSPLDLAEQRPDLRAALDRAEAAGLRRSAALRALLPTLGLSASAGWQATWIEEWNEQDTWTVGGSLSVPIFNGGSTHAGRRANRAAEEVRRLQLESALRSAVQEVESARYAEEQQALRLQAATTQREAAEAAWTVAGQAYAAGTADYLQVQSALSTLLAARLGELQASRDRLGALIQLHQAMGGAWTETLNEDSP